MKEDIRNTYKTMEHDKGHKHTCYHCQKQFEAKSFPQGIVLVLIIFLANVGTLLFMLSIMTTLNFVLLFVVTLLYMALFFLLLPYFIKFKKVEKKRNKD